MLEQNGLSRRALLQRALLLAGASAAIGACDAIGLADNDGPFRFDAEQMALLTAVADLTIPATETPGALDVQVPALFEGLMANWASPETREVMIGAMAEIAALPTDGREFASLDKAEQLALLAAHDEAALAPTGESAGGLFSLPSAANPAYQRFKELVVTLYYYSEPGQTQELGYVHAPGGWEPSVPVTPDSRPAGGTGGF